MSTITTPKQLRATTHRGRAKPGYIFTLLRLKGFEPFSISDGAYAQERVRHDDGTWTDVRLRTDLRGVPITRQMIDGELQDVTWWHGPVTDAVCSRCSIADGLVRAIVRSTRPSRVRSDNRLPVLKDAGTWHIGCLKIRTANLGRYGRDVAVKSGVTRCHCKPNADGEVTHKHK